ncbi:MAG: hypothetical protein HYR94_05070 [Chloroflexi bacterium]|nr:hypothetical protein [Chloroflexota bacterium]
MTTSKLFDVICLPVYSPSPSSSEAIRAEFSQVFGLEEGQSLVNCILADALIRDPYEKLTQKAIAIVEILSAQRQRIDTLREKLWAEFLALESTGQKAIWLEQNRMNWSRKGADKVIVTDTFQNLVRLFQEIGCLSVGAKDIPLCLIPHHQRKSLADSLSNLYSGSIATEFIDWVTSSDLPLIVIWITGFKPRGDDSRPDRGLVPLARMSMWTTLQNSPQQLARQNGLWEAIINLSDAILVDSVTAVNNPIPLLLQEDRHRFQGKIRFSLASPTGLFSEHDVDAILHLLFARQAHWGIFEAMCNPPGGDWSGLSVLDFQTKEEYRWTSLPRVSGVDSKRPDHVIEFLIDDGSLALLAIESKNRASNLEVDVGNRLKTYTRQLIETPPTISKATNVEWKLWQGNNILWPNLAIISGGAFCWGEEKELKNSLVRCQLDIAFAIEFESIEESALLHIKTAPRAEFLLPKILELVEQFGGRLEIQVH